MKTEIGITDEKGNSMKLYCPECGGDNLGFAGRKDYYCKKCGHQFNQEDVI